MQACHRLYLWTQVPSLLNPVFSSPTHFLSRAPLHPAPLPNRNTMWATHAITHFLLASLKKEKRNVKLISVTSINPAHPNIISTSNQYKKKNCQWGISPSFLVPSLQSPAAIGHWWSNSVLGVEQHCGWWLWTARGGPTASTSYTCLSLREPNSCCF